MDYAAWARRAAEFLHGLTHLPGRVSIDCFIDGPGTDDGTQEWLHSPSCSLPQELKSFIGAAGKQCSFHCRWTPPAGAQAELAELVPFGETFVAGGNFCDATRLHNDDERDWFERTAPRLLKENARRSIDSQPPSFSDSGFLASARRDLAEDAAKRVAGFITLMKLDDGDEIVLESSLGGGMGRVRLHAASDPAENRVISPSFNQFLTDWERMCFIAPTRPNLAPWLDPVTGLLAPDEGKVRRLREFLANVAVRGRKPPMPSSFLQTWAGRIESFVRGLNQLSGTWSIDIDIEPPATATEVEAVAATLPFGLPRPLREFYIEVAAAFRCKFQWQPPQKDWRTLASAIRNPQSIYAGAEFFALRELQDAHGIHTWWDAVDQVGSPPEWELDRAVWRRTAPFFDFRNGDCLALHVTDDPDRLPVVRLDHEGFERPVSEVSASFAEFLRDWESIGYLWPWNVNGFPNLAAERAARFLAALQAR